MVLENPVLENLVVYQLGLSKIPKSILNGIRRNTFEFLWSRKIEKTKMHLVRLEKLARPKDLSGWDLKLYI